jgi:hypothetical protein
MLALVFPLLGETSCQSRSHIVWLCRACQLQVQDRESELNPPSHARKLGRLQKGRNADAAQVLSDLLMQGWSFGQVEKDLEDRLICVSIQTTRIDSIYDVLGPEPSKSRIGNTRTPC